MKRERGSQVAHGMAAMAAVCFCLAPVGASGDERDRPHADSQAVVHSIGSATPAGHPITHPGAPMVLAPDARQLSFDLGGSEARKLELTLDQPLLVQMRSAAPSATNAGLLGLDATLGLAVLPGLGLTASAEHNFQPVGSIQCLNGTLRPDSYTASGCRFVNDAPALFDSSTLSLGAVIERGSASASAGWFTSRSSNANATVQIPGQFDSAPLLDQRLLTPLAASPWPALPASTTFLGSEISGIDMNFRVGITTDRAGDLSLGLGLTRVLDASHSGLPAAAFSPLDWSLAKPFDSAVLGLEWHHGAFSSGVRGYYREPVSFLDRSSLDSMQTFDVHFTWHTPWKANLSVGASNVLNAGVDDAKPGPEPADQFESVYGRIPYVRYQQDL